LPLRGLAPVPGPVPLLVLCGTPPWFFGMLLGLRVVSVALPGGGVVSVLGGSVVVGGIPGVGVVFGGVIVPGADVPDGGVDVGVSVRAGDVP
jgi:hypothetical protein